MMYQLYTTHQLGSLVNIQCGDQTQPALVVAITHHNGGRVCYQVVWWSGGTRHCEWVEDCELSHCGDALPTVGFHAAHSRY